MAVILLQRWNFVLSYLLYIMNNSQQQVFFMFLQLKGMLLVFMFSLIKFACVLGFGRKIGILNSYSMNFTSFNCFG